jgi:HAD superfamily hydrolase (TIGR01509 family)
VPALLFGSISTLADTSELQRESFNAAFQEHGLDWSWGRDEYRKMLEGNGGAARIEQFAAERGETVDAAAVHSTKSRIFQQRLSEGGIKPRDGVVETLAGLREHGTKAGLVTTTSPENVAALLGALSPTVSSADFSVIVDSGSVRESKPDAAAYRYALEQLGEQASDCLAIEDNVGGVGSAKAAGLTCIAFPNVNTKSHDFTSADATVIDLELDQLRQFVSDL